MKVNKIARLRSVVVGKEDEVYFVAGRADGPVKRRDFNDNVLEENFALKGDARGQ